MKYQALSFDCYGTLIDWERGIAEWLDSWGRHNGLDVPGEELVRRLFDAQRIEQGHDTFLSYRSVLSRSLAHLSDSCGIPVDEGACERFAQSVVDWPAFDDSARSLETLARQGRILCVISNVDRDLFAGSAARLERQFDILITAEDVKGYKPGPRHFDTLVASLGERGLDENDLLHVAHSRFHDIAPANVRGWTSCRVTRHGDNWAPEGVDGIEGTFCVPHMKDVVDLLGRIDPA